MAFNGSDDAESCVIPECDQVTLEEEEEAYSEAGLDKADTESAKDHDYLKA